MSGPADAGAVRLAAVALLLALPGSLTGQILPPRAPQGGPSGLPDVSFIRPAAVIQAERDRLVGALSALKPQRPGVTDAYVVVVALHSDRVFGREAREAGRVLSRRYGAEGRTVVLAPEERGERTAGPGSPDSLALALARIGQVADRQEDAIVVYATTHGSPINGLQYKDKQRGFGDIPPERLAAMLDASGMANRLVILSACYSGVFLPRLAADRTAAISAAASDRPSFGCSEGNDWTYFGDALVNRALRKPQPLAAAFAEARALVTSWERRARLRSSNPQMSIGRDVGRWLTPLEQSIPAEATRPVGRSPAGR